MASSENTPIEGTNPNIAADWLAWLRLGNLTRRLDVFIGLDEPSNGLGFVSGACKPSQIAVASFRELVRAYLQ